MKKISPVYYLLAGLVALTLTGCASTGVQRTSLDRERPLSEKFDADDARLTVEMMVDSMLQFEPVIALTQNGRPVLDLAEIQNRTMDHIDTRALTTSMRTRLLRTGKFRFTDRATSKTDIQIMGEQNELGLVDRQAAVKPGSQSAIELYLYGEISQDRKTSGRLVDQYYKINMSLKDLNSGELIWTDEQEIRKEMKRSRL
jgi:uncharacterized protein (TIGR02722 family)